ncbi:MAG: hypothetical protein LRY27_04655 [Chitinophagales bacterium]|nr:hypothetical protein [Chitinophagales bacterium]
MYAQLLKQGIDLSKPFNKVMDLIVSLTNKPQQAHHNYTTQKTQNDEQDIMNKIVEKLAKVGYAGLSGSEKDFLMKNKDN